MAITKRIKVNSFEKVSKLPLRSITGASGRDGKSGAVGGIGPKGDRGVQGFSGSPGTIGDKGLQGLPGLNGKSVSIEEIIQSLKKDNKFLESTKGEPGKDGESQGWVSGSTNPVKYKQVISAAYTVRSGSLIDGMNVFGVNVASACTITLPTNIRESQMIIINDESGDANSNNITITT